MGSPVTKKVRITGKRSLGVQKVFDFSMPSHHNFVLDSGVVAHNCSYGIVAYNGMYLKHKYPNHFYLGELSVRSNHEDIQEILEECRDIVLGPSILKSHPTDWMIEGDKLRAPLSIIKGCGGVGAIGIHKLVAEGDVKTEKDLFDLMAKTKADKRKDIKLDVGTLSALLFAGAMDELLSETPNYKLYITKRDEMAKVLKSKAALAKKKKNESIGLDDVDSDLKLNLWRMQANPLHHFSFARFFEGALKNRGFVLTGGKNMIAEKIDNGTHHQIWASCTSLENPQIKRMLQIREKEAVYHFYLLGQVVERNHVAGPNKKRLSFNVFTGEDVSPRITMWPPYKQNDIAPVTLQSLQKGSIGLIKLTGRDSGGTFYLNATEWHELRV